MDPAMPRRVIAGHRLGDLEAEVLQQLWAAREPLTGWELVERLTGPPRAYTTVMTVLSRLVDKGLVERSLEGKSYRYRPAGDPDALTARAIERLLASAHDRGAVLARLIEELDDPGLLDELAAVLARARRS
jgi:predicted transcriptional regulator